MSGALLCSHLLNAKQTDIIRHSMQLLQLQVLQTMDTNAGLQLSGQQHYVCPSHTCTGVHNLDKLCARTAK